MAEADERLVAEVDEFLQSTKWLEGPPPDWAPSGRPNELRAIWNLIDDLGINRGHLRFRVSTASPDYPSVSIIYQGNPVWRLDLTPQNECEGNPLWATRVGLPAEVCGSHCHNWDDNRAYIMENGFGELPCRRPVEVQLKRVPQMLFWIAARTSLELLPDQRAFDIPPSKDLFDWLG